MADVVIQVGHGQQPCNLTLPGALDPSHPRTARLHGHHVTYCNPVGRSHFRFWF